jgi:DNA-binding transcriptional LysR family regulator
MKLESLCEFVTLVKCQSFTKAARELYLSQPSLSAHIGALEKELGFDLIERSPLPHLFLSLTPAGAGFLDYAQKILAVYAEAKEYCSGIARELPPLKLQAMSTNLKRYQALARLEGYSFTFVDLDLETDLFSALEKGIVDLGACSSYAHIPVLREQAETKGVAFVETGYGSIAFCLMKNHPLAANERLTRQDLNGQTIVINSGAHFDSWKQVVTHLLGADIDLTFHMNPMKNRSNLMAADFGEMIHISGAPMIQEHFAHRNDMVIFDTLDGEKLLCAEILAYLTSNTRAGELATALKAELDASR